MNIGDDIPVNAEALRKLRQVLEDLSIDDELPTTIFADDVRAALTDLRRAAVDVLASADWPP